MPALAKLMAMPPPSCRRRSPPRSGWAGWECPRARRGSWMRRARRRRRAGAPSTPGCRSAAGTARAPCAALRRMAAWPRRRRIGGLERRGVPLRRCANRRACELEEPLGVRIADREVAQQPGLAILGDHFSAKATAPCRRSPSRKASMSAVPRSCSTGTTVPETIRFRAASTPTAARKPLRAARSWQEAQLDSGRPICAPAEATR